MAIDKFTESAGAKLGERVAGLITTAPAAYAACGLAAWLISTGPSDGWRRLADWVTEQQTGRLLVWTVLGLLAIAAAGVIVRQFVPQAIRLLEGYWPSVFKHLADRGARRQWTRRTKLVDVIRELAPAVEAGTANPEAERKFEEADRERAKVPSRRSWVLPTQLGNTLRSAETRPYEKYGLDPIKLWPLIWLILPANVREELVLARARLDAATAALLWSVLGIAFVVIAWWTVPAALVSAVAIYRFWVLPAAADYADLFEATYDVHRFDLYAALRLAPPVDAGDERQTGKRLNTFVWRGGDSGVRFTHRD